MSIEHLTGRFNPASDPAFVRVAPGHAANAGMLMRKESYEDFKAMFNAAQKDGVRLTIVSATRNFDQQRAIWENKWLGRTLVGGRPLTQVKAAVERARAILSYSSMPMTSRHHWGTDIDLISVEGSYFKAGPGKKAYDWLVGNAGRFGFGQPYTGKGEERQHGYEEEQWHWSHVPLASELLREYHATMSYDDISGFLGAETARELLVIEHYVLGVSAACR